VHLRGDRSGRVLVVGALPPPTVFAGDRIDAVVDDGEPAASVLYDVAHC
jgi:hypothetical protein